MKNKISVGLLFLVVFSFAFTVFAANYNLGNVTLKNGSRGESVMELQRFLNDNLNLGLVIDGKLGPKTIAVIKKWQTDNGLVDDGLIGAKTKLRMNSMGNIASTPGSDRDAHGCIGSAGYQWCDAKQKCLRTFEESCVSSTTNPTSNLNKPALSLLYPNGGESFKGGDQVVVKWTSSNVSDYSFTINLKYYDKDNNFITDQELASFVPAGDNQKVVTIPTTLKQMNYVYKVSKYKISIGKIPSEYVLPGDISDNFFTIDRLPQIGTEYAIPSRTSAELSCIYKYQFGTDNPEITFEYGEDPCPLTSIDGLITPSCTNSSKIIGTQTYSSEPVVDATEKMFTSKYNILNLKPNTKYNYQCIVKNNKGKIVGYDKSSSTTYVQFNTTQ